MGTIRSLAKSSIALLFSDAFSLVLAALFSIILGRISGEELFGVFSLAFLLYTFAKTLIDLGYDYDIPRTVATNKENIAELLLQSQTIKNSLWLVSLPVFIGIGFTFIKSPLFIILLVFNLPCSISTTFKAALRGLGRYNAITALETVFNFILYSAATLVVYFYFSLELVLLLYLIVEIPKSFCYYKYIKKQIPESTIQFTDFLNFTFKKNVFKGIFAQLKLLTVNILSTLQFRSRTLVLGWFSTDFAVGEFSGAIRFITFLRVIPGAILHTLLPELSKDGQFSELSGKLQKKFYKILFIVSVIGLILSGTLFIFADFLIELTFKFNSAAPILKILSWTIALITYCYAIEAFLIARRLEHKINIGLTISTLLIFVLSVILIPLHSALGVAWASLAGELFLALYYSALLIKVK